MEGKAMDVFTITRTKGDNTEYQVHGNVSLVDALQMVVEALVATARGEGYQQALRDLQALDEAKTKVHKVDG